MRLTNTLNENTLTNQLKKKYPSVELNLYDTGTQITISKIIVPVNLRGHGVGSKVMQEICDYADKHKITLILDPTDVFGASSVARLQKFYKRFGFVLNKGDHQNSNVNRQMYRLPL